MCGTRKSRARVRGTQLRARAISCKAASPLIGLRAPARVLALCVLCAARLLVCLRRCKLCRHWLALHAVCGKAAICRVLHALTNYELGWKRLRRAWVLLGHCTALANSVYAKRVQRIEQQVRTLCM